MGLVTNDSVFDYLPPAEPRDESVGWPRFGYAGSDAGCCAFEAARRYYDERRLPVPPLHLSCSCPRCSPRC